MVVHPTVPAQAVNDVIRGMTVHSCWNGRWSWNADEDSYTPMYVPVVVDRASPEATQRLGSVGDDCRGSSAEMDVTQRAFFDGAAHCLLLVLTEGTCLPFAVNGTQGHFAGIPVACDTPPSTRFPSLMHLTTRLAGVRDSCDASAGQYYIWLDALDTGFCYNIL